MIVFDLVSKMGMATNIIIRVLDGTRVFSEVDNRDRLTIECMMREVVFFNIVDNVLIIQTTDIRRGRRHD